jgi:hypothetical protein
MENNNMSWLSTILTSGNAIPLVIALAALILLIAFLAKKGIISFRGHGLSVGNNEIERTIIRNQIMFCKTEVSDFYSKIPNFEGRDDWRLKYIMEKCLDVFIDAISLNHITLEPVYVELKCRAVWDEILQNAEDPHILTDEFKKTIYDEVKKILEKLIEIRQYYTK